MSEFEKEYKDLGFRSQILDVVLTDKDIVENFKDWHSADECKILKAELERVYSVLGFLVKAHDELWTMTDGREQLENAIDDAKNILRNRE